MTSPTSASIIKANNSHGKQLVDYSIADGWTELDKTTLTEKGLDKYLNIFTDKKSGKMTVDPTDASTKIYYRVVNGTDESHRFEYPVLRDNTVSYSSTLTNDDLGVLKDFNEEDRTLIFQTYAIQMVPFGDPAETDAEKVSEGAVDAWNQDAAATKSASTSTSDITAKANSITINPTVAGDEYLVVPAGADPSDYDWTKAELSEKGDALEFDNLDPNTSYEVVSRTPASGDKDASEPSEPTPVTTEKAVESIEVTEQNGKSEVEAGDTLLMLATILPDGASKSVTWSSSDDSVATVNDVGLVTGVAAGNVTITATAKYGQGVTGIKKECGKTLYQAQLHGITNGNRVSQAE